MWGVRLWGGGGGGGGGSLFLCGEKPFGHAGSFPLCDRDSLTFIRASSLLDPGYGSSTVVVPYHIGSWL